MVSNFSEENSRRWRIFRVSRGCGMAVAFYWGRGRFPSFIFLLLSFGGTCGTPWWLCGVRATDSGGWWGFVPDRQAAAARRTEISSFLFCFYA